MMAGKGLCHSHEGVVDSLITVGMKFPEDFSHDAGTFSVGTAGIQMELGHAVQDPTVDGFETVAGIR